MIQKNNKKNKKILDKLILICHNINVLRKIKVHTAKKTLDLIGVGVLLCKKTMNFVYLVQKNKKKEGNNHE